MAPALPAWGDGFGEEDGHGMASPGTVTWGTLRVMIDCQGRGRCGARAGGVVWKPARSAPERRARGRYRWAADSACGAAQPGI